MQVIGLTADEQNSIFRVIATILWLGNVDFVEGDDGNAAVSDTGVTDFVGYLMECDPTSVQKVLTTRIVETSRGGRRGERALFGHQTVKTKDLVTRFRLRGPAEYRASFVRERRFGQSFVS